MLTQLPARILRRLEHDRAVTQLECDFRRLMTGRPVVRGDGKKIAFATFGGGEWHLAFELLLAQSLQLRNARPEFLICDIPALPICAERLVNSTSQDRCGGCLAVKQNLLDASGVRWQGMSRFVDESSVSRARGIAAAVAPDQIDAYVERGFPVGRWLHVAACNFLRCDARGDAAEKIETRRRLLATAIVGVEAVERWLDDVTPDVVLVQGGAHVLWRIALESARARNIPVVSRELGKGGWNRQMFALNRDAMAPDLDREWAVARTQALTAAEEAEVNALAANLAADTYLAAESDAGEARIDIDPSRKLAVAFTNVTWDLATADRDVAFSGVFDWLTETMRALSGHSNVQLVVRAHPAEASVMTRERIVERIGAEWPAASRVIVVPPGHPITAPELFSRAELVLAYNSTAGLEAAMHDKPVVIGGAPHFRGRGFTIDVERRDEYREMLRRWAAGGQLPEPLDRREMARRYFHLFFARYQIPMGWTTSPLEPPYQLRITSLAELEPGRNAAVDLVCNGILNGTQILKPRAGEASACAR
jgi:hypothetical protein